jgi:hypothetical protein
VLLRTGLLKKQTAKEFINEILNLEEKLKIKVIVLLWQWRNERKNIKEEVYAKVMVN